MRIVAIIFGILAAIVDLILVIVSIAVPEVSLWGWIVVLTIVTVGLFFSANKVKKQKEARQAAQVARNTPFMEETAISAIAQGELPVVTGTPVLLEEGEVAHYYAPATKIVTKNKAVGRTGSGAGVRVRVAKGVSVSTGGGSSRTVYGEVTKTRIFKPLAISFSRSKSSFLILILYHREKATFARYAHRKISIAQPIFVRFSSNALNTFIPPSCHCRFQDHIISEV